MVTSHWIVGDTGTRRSLRSSKVGRKAGSTGLSRKFPKQPVGGSVPREEVGGGGERALRVQQASQEPYALQDGDLEQVLGVKWPVGLFHHN